MKTKMRRFAPTFLRISMSLIIIWFGIQQVTDTKAWIDYLPAWTNQIPLTPANLIMLNGSFEIIFGALMLFGFYVRFVAFFLALHLFEIAHVVGYNPTGARDLGLGLATFTVFLFGNERRGEI